MPFLHRFRSRGTSTARSSGDAVMSLGDHLDELRRRLLYALLGIVPIFVVGLIYGKSLLAFAVAPVENALIKNHNSGSLLVTGVMEGITNYIKVAAILAIVLGGPWILYQLWKFISPGLHKHERRFVQVLAPMSSALSILGLAFMYYLMLPVALNFFVQFNQDLLSRPPVATQPLPAGIQLPSIPVLAADPADPKPGQMWINQSIAQLRVAVGESGASAVTSARPQVLGMPLRDDSFVAQHYKIEQTLSLLLTFALTFALAFQTPVVVLLLGWLDIIRVQTMVKYRKQAMGVCLCIGALFTPPDFISWVALAVPLYLLFELGLILLRLLPAERIAGGSVLEQRKPENTQA